MSIAPPRFIDDLQSVETLSAPPIHWPSALVGLVLAVTLVVGVTWLASIRRPDARVPVREAPAVSPMAETEPPVVVIPTPIPPPPVRDPAPAAPERLKVANTRGQGVNLRADASERAARIKVLPEGTLLEPVAGPEGAGGGVWQHVREPSGAVGWVASSFVTAASATP
jgi:hypothetical protein